MLDYVSITPVSRVIPPAKQAAHRHYGSHPYFTKRAWNVVREYIKTFSDEGDVVLDPFGGSGITAIEALVLRRKAIHVDIAPFANFMTEQIAVSPVDLQAMSDGFEQVKAECEAPIAGLYGLTAEEIQGTSVPYWFPKDVALPSNADVPTVEACFHRRSLMGLSMLLHSIEKIDDPVIRDVFKLAFAATLVKTNLTFSSTRGRLESRGDSGIFRVYRYWVPKRTIELNVWQQFTQRYRGVFAAKMETNQAIGDWYRPGDTVRIIQGSATELDKYVPAESIDYIFTDPPYGAHIAYLDLLTMWHAWLRMDVSERDRKLEVIEGGELGKSKAQYSKLLEESIDQMFRALKPDRWFSIVFSHKDPAYWDTIVRAAQTAGFEYANTTVQKAYQPSLHKRKNPLKVLSGELILNFRKVKNPRTIAISALGSDVVRLIKNVAELEIVRNGGATTEQIYAALIPALLEHGLLAEVKKKFADITPLLEQDFIVSDVDNCWHLRETTKLGAFIPIQERIAFYVTDYLKRVQRLDQKATFDDVVQNVMPNLINGIQPTHQSILKVLQEIAYSQDGVHWELGARLGQAKQLQLRVSEAAAEIPSLPYPINMTHTEVIYRLAKMALSAGLLVHIGKKEQADTFINEKLASLSLPVIPRREELSNWAKSKIEQIDCTWYSSEGIPCFAFEVEATTPITTGIDRFLELLSLQPRLAGRLVILAPRQRVKELNAILRSSHYIGHPMYMENKLSYMFYDDFLGVYSRLVEVKRPSASQLLGEFDKAVTKPTTP